MNCQHVSKLLCAAVGDRRSFSFQLISHYLQGKIDSGSKQEVQLVGKLLIDMILVSHKFNNELAASKGIGKVFHLVGSVLPLAKSVPKHSL